MKFFFIVLFLLCKSSFSQEAPAIPISIPSDIVCQVHDDECQEYFVNSEPYHLELKDKNTNKKWKVSLYFSPSFHYYAKSDINVDLGEDTKFTMEDVKIKQRHSMRFYKFWDKEINGSFTRWIDEPSNTFTITFEKNDHEFSFSLLHPKYQINYLWGGKDKIHNNTIRVHGVHQGQEIDATYDIGNSKWEYMERPYFPSWLNTRRHLQPTIGYGKKIPIINNENGKKWSLTYIPSVNVGVHLGNGSVQYVNHHNNQFVWNEKESKFHLQGYSVALGNKLTLSNRKDNFGFFLENRSNFSKMNTKIFDGTAKYNLFYTKFSLGLHVRLFKGGK